jgi:hypothetical protein
VSISPGVVDLLGGIGPNRSFLPPVGILRLAANPDHALQK